MSVSARSVALAAAAAAVDDHIAAAKAAMIAVLGDPSGVFSAFTVEDRVATETYTLIVFTDGDIHLGVRTVGDGWDVHLVTPAGSGVDGWSENGPSIESLAHLGKVLPDLDPVDENAAPAIPAWTTSVAYKVGDKVTYGGFTWQCVQAHTSQAGWEPPNVPALWTKVA